MESRLIRAERIHEWNNDVIPIACHLWIVWHTHNIRMQIVIVDCMVGKRIAIFMLSCRSSYSWMELKDQPNMIMERRGKCCLYHLWVYDLWDYEKYISSHVNSMCVCISRCLITHGRCFSLARCPLSVCLRLPFSVARIMWIRLSPSEAINSQHREDHATNGRLSQMKCFKQSGYQLRPNLVKRKWQCSHKHTSIQTHARAKA